LCDLRVPERGVLARLLIADMVRMLDDLNEQHTTLVYVCIYPSGSGPAYSGPIR